MLEGAEEKFPNGESRNELSVRARQAIEEFVLPHVWDAARKGKKNVHVALVSHGLCVAQLVAELLKKDRFGAPEGDYSGLLNTAWTRLSVDVKASKEGEPLDFPDGDLPPLTVKVTHVNQHSHINGIKRQKGGLGSAAYDPKQEDIRAFFGGKTTALAPAESNARDSTA